MPPAVERVRSLALALPGVEERTCHGRPAFYVRGRMILCLRDDHETLVVWHPRKDRARLLRSNPGVFFVTDHYLNYDAVLLNLRMAEDGLLRGMIESARMARAPMNARRGTPARRNTRKAG